MKIKNIYLTLGLSLLTIVTYAQDFNQMTVYSESGLAFTLYVDALQQNDVPVPNVFIPEIPYGAYTVRIDFEDPNLPDIVRKNLPVGESSSQGHLKYVIRKSIRGNLVLRFQGYTPLETEPPTGVYVVTPAAVATTSTITTTTTTQSTNTGNPDGVSVNFNLGGLSISASANDGGLNGSITSTSTTTSSTVTSSSATSNTTVIGTNYAPCEGPMPGDRFLSAKRQLADESFDDSRLSTAKSIIQANCFTSEQILTVCQLFDFEDNRLEFAKYAYDFCLDQQNYFQVNQAFDFSDSADELDKYVSERR